MVHSAPLLPHRVWDNSKFDIIILRYLFIFLPHMYVSTYVCACNICWYKCCCPSYLEFLNPCAHTQTFPKAQIYDPFANGTGNSSLAPVFLGDFDFHSRATGGKILSHRHTLSCGRQDDPCSVGICSTYLPRIPSQAILFPLFPCKFQGVCWAH